MYSKLGHLKSTVTLFNHIPGRNVMSCNIMINAYVKSGELESACQVFDEMSDRTVATWNAMIAGAVQYECNEHGLKLFSEMHRSGFRPDEYALASVLRGCAGLRDLPAGNQVHGYIVKYGFGVDMVVSSSLSHMYMKSGRMEEGERVIESMETRNVVAWNTLIAGKAQGGFSKEVLDSYSVMRLTGLRPDKITLVSVITSCSEMATLGRGQKVHAEAIKSGSCSSVSLITALVTMYSKCGSIGDSVRAFEEFNHYSDPVLWTAMISANGLHGRGSEAVEMFERMEQKGLMEGNDVAFLSLLYACSHCGMKEKGIEIFDLMVEKYGINPRLEHYNCKVDLLARSGCLEEAEAVIRSMPVKPDAIIWKTLLSGCKTRKNAEMAARVSEEILKLDPNDSALHVLLSNIYASAQRWNDVSEVRKAMKDKSLVHELGVSWVEIKNETHRFHKGGESKSDPRSVEIYRYLDGLVSEMKLRGYVPETGVVLHDTEAEEKEESLTHHSEKLALAFALMNTPKGAPVRVMKNLRMCEDCHCAIKFVSEIERREIVVRDATRFHHFKDGTCSCGDYW